MYNIKIVYNDGSASCTHSQQWDYQTGYIVTAKPNLNLDFLDTQCTCINISYSSDSQPQILSMQLCTYLNCMVILVHYMASAGHNTLSCNDYGVCGFNIHDITQSQFPGIL